MRTLSLFLVAFAAMACRRDEATFTAAAAPSLGMSDPQPADWRRDGPMIASGSTTGLSSVEVDGVPVVLNGSSWSAEIDLSRGVNVVEVRGVDGSGSSHYLRHGVLAGDFGSSSDPVAEGLVARVNQGGLDFALGEAASLIEADAINTMIAGTTVYEDAYGILGWNAVEVAADVGWLWFDAPELEATPRQGRLDVEVVIPALDVWVPVRGQVVGFDFDVDAWLWADEVVLTGTLEVDARNGKLRADLVDVDVALLGFDFDTSLLPGQIESWLLVDTVTVALEDMLVEQVALMLPPMIEEQLAALELAFDTDLMGTPLSVSADFVSASVDPDGLVIVADVNADSPDKGQHGGVGPLITREAVAHPDRDADFGLSLSDDLLNRFLYELWGAGLLDLGLSTADGSLDAILLHQLGAKEEAAINVSPTLPPVLVEKKGVPQLQLGELMVEILTPGGEHGERIVLSVTVLVDLEVRVVDGVVELSLGEPDVDMIVRENDWNVSNETLTNALVDAIPVDLLLALIGKLEFPLPSLGGISVDRAEVGRDSGGAHTGIGLTLK